MKLVLQITIGVAMGALLALQIHDQMIKQEVKEAVAALPKLAPPPVRVDYQKYQLTIPKAVVQGAGFRRGDEVVCESIGNAIHIRRIATTDEPAGSTADRLLMFDLATERQAHRQHLHSTASTSNRGWTREELYES